MKNFKNKIVVITGAASGMGAAYADEFAKLGARLALCDVNEGDLNAVSNRVKKIIGDENLYTEIVDVSDRKAVYNFAENVKSRLGSAHVIINNAGIEGATEPVYTMPIDTLERVVQINFLGVVYGTKAFLPQLVQNNEGAVVNISSVFGLIAPPSCADYCATKFAVRGFTESLMAEFHKSPISIHCVHPGGIDTNIVKSEVGKVFAEKLLITPPHDIVKYVIKSISKGKEKIVYGNRSFFAWLTSNIFPQRLVNKLLWKEMEDAIDLESYKKFIK
jgi:butyryl-CoA dehydrogenase